MGFFKKTFKNQGKDINEQEAQQSVEKETTLLAASVKANNPKLILDSIVKLAQQDKAIENMILAAAAKLEFIKGVSEDKGLPKEAKEALIKLSDIL